MNYRSRASWVAVAGVVTAFALVQGAALAEDLGQLLDVGSKSLVASARSQDRIDAIADDTAKLLADFRQVSQQVDSLRVYNRQLEELLEAQEEEKVSLTSQIEGVTVVERQITPLMLEMIQTLSEFVAGDLPFLLEERNGRIQEVAELQTRADVTVAERYRRLLEAYTIETEFGRTIESYRGEVEIDGTTREVDFLRFGRIVLIYRTLDGDEVGIWDRDQAQWTRLDNNYRTAVRQGLRIAQKQAAPNLLRLPIPAPGEGE